MAVLAQMQLEAVAVLGGVGAVRTSVLVHVRVRLHVAVQHRLVHTAVVTVVALEWFCS